MLLFIIFNIVPCTCYEQRAKITDDERECDGEHLWQYGEDDFGDIIHGGLVDCEREDGTRDGECDSFEDARVLAIDAPGYREVGDAPGGGRGESAAYGGAEHGRLP